MTREIKFRAFEKTKKEMHQVGSIWGFPNIRDITIPDGDSCTTLFYNFELMQYTGLKDKNGVEIYEGDIITYDDDESMSHWVSGEDAVIINLPGRFVARMKPYDTQEWGNQNALKEEFQDSVTIIGNIYQNPELLSEK